MSFGGTRTLKEVYTDRTIDVLEWGDLIGTSLANSHQQTRSTDIGKNVCGRLAYNDLEIALRKYAQIKGLGERINTKYGALLATDDECLCHGDYWPGNLLISEDKMTLTVLD